MSVVPSVASAYGLSATLVVEDRCLVVELPSSWETYLQLLPGKERHELTRKIRRLAREAPDTRVPSASTRAEIETRLGDFLDLHRRSRTGKARFMDTRMEGSSGALRSRWPIWAWCGCGSSTVPVAPWPHSSPSNGTGRWASTTRASIPDRAALSPGLVLLGHVIRDAIARGKRRFDFLRGEERYKYDFGPQPEDLYRVTIAPGARNA